MDFGSFAFAMIGHLLASFLYVLRRLNIVDAVVDTSSILEHREELRELWEKKMMAEDQTSSTPSKKYSQLEEAPEEVVTANGESETARHHKLANGFAKPLVESDKDNTCDSNMNSIPNDTVAIEANEKDIVDADLENNNSADSLEEDNDDYVEEKTYTSTLVMKQSVIKEVTSDLSSISTETVIQTEAVKESVTEEKQTSETSPEEVEEITPELVDDKISGSEPPQCETIETTEEVAVPSADDAKPEEELAEAPETLPDSSSENVTSVDEVKEPNEATQISENEPAANPIVTKELEEDSKDGFVSVGEALSQGSENNPAEVPEETLAFESSEIQTSEICVTTETVTRTETELVNASETTQPVCEKSEMENLARGGLKRVVLPGVQQTEQPYSSCTTETKIAMEIREMREREEELRLMREQALLSPVVSPVPPKSPTPRSPSPSPKETIPPGPGYRVSSVFGPPKGPTSPSPSLVEDANKSSNNRPFNKESAVEKEIRLARDREEELRKQKGLPPREDDSYVKPSQVKSSQVRVFSKMAAGDSVKQAATAKIQLEIEEQTQREMALREMGHIQTISQERTDSKVAKLKVHETTSPIIANGNSHPLTNGNYTNGRSSPDACGVPKRSTPSPTGPKNTQNGVPKGISMQKFIASRGKETTFSAPRNGSPFQPREEVRAAVPPPMVKLKRNVSVESKIQQEILEMKQREEELRKQHMNRSCENSVNGNEEHDIELELNQKNNIEEYENGINEVEEISPRHNKLIAQWEKRIQKAES